MENKMKKDFSASGILFVGCIFIGLGLGIIFNVVVAGLLVGLGTGFLSRGII
ncbi:MAG: hypothetical protein KQI35_14695 [Bacteroidetes bacterium]|nr:hypothetical protein [Bacteroidota bacterium]